MSGKKGRVASGFLFVALLLGGAGIAHAVDTTGQAVRAGAGVSSWSWNLGKTPLSVETSRPEGVTHRDGGLAAAAVKLLAERCAATTPAKVLVTLARVESGFDPLAIHDNTSGRSYTPASRQAALELTSRLIATGHNLDLGLLQLNTRTLQDLHLSVTDSFEPCRALSIAGRIVDANYARSLQGRSHYSALQTAYSLYNTGSLRRGLTNGYADRVAAAAVLQAKGAETGD